MPTRGPLRTPSHGLWVLLSLAACDSYDETLLLLRASGGSSSPAPVRPRDAGEHTAPDAGVLDRNERHDGEDAHAAQGGSAAQATTRAIAAGAGGAAANAGTAGDGSGSGSGSRSGSGSGNSAGMSAGPDSGGAGSNSVDDHVRDAGAGPSSAGSAAQADAGGAGNGFDAGEPTADAGAYLDAGGDASPRTTCDEPGGQIWAANAHCYFPLDQSQSWNVSRDQCLDRGAMLVVIGSAQEQAFVSGLVGSSARWIGLAKFGAPEFSWVTGETLSYLNWDTGAPNSSGEVAAVMSEQSHAWRDEPVTTLHAALCERP